jgi:hypothetical protein
MRFSPQWFVDFRRTRVGASYWKDEGGQAPEGLESVVIEASFIVESACAIGEASQLHNIKAGNANLGKSTG